MWDDSLALIPYWWRKPVVKVRLHSVPPETGNNFVFVLCKTHVDILRSSFYLLSIYGVEWPDISRSRPVSGDYNPFPRSHATHNVIHSSDDGNFGQTHHCVLKVFCFCQGLQKGRAALITVSFPHISVALWYRHTSRTNQLTGILRNSKADTTFFHQFHQCSLPDDQK